MEPNFNRRLQDYNNSLKHSTIKLYASVIGLFVLAILFAVTFIYSRKPNVSDAIAVIPFLIAIIPTWWLFRFKRITKHFTQDIVQELKVRMTTRKELEEIKFAICEFLHELFDARAVKLKIHNSIPVTRPAEVDPHFDRPDSIHWLDSEYDQSGNPRKIIVGRFKKGGSFANQYITRIRIDLTKEIYLGDLILMTRQRISSSNRTLLSSIEDEIDTWIMYAIERFNLLCIINFVRTIDELANTVDSGDYSASNVITMLLDCLAKVTSSRNIFAELMERRWEGTENIDTWQDKEWRYISGRYSECKKKIANAGYEQVERFPVPWRSESGELILLPIYFDAKDKHLGYIVFQSDQFEINVEKGLAQVEDLVLDNLIQRIVAAEKSGT